MKQNRPKIFSNSWGRYWFLFSRSVYKNESSFIELLRGVLQPCIVFLVINRRVNLNLDLLTYTL